MIEDVWDWILFVMDLALHCAGDWKHALDHLLHLFIEMRKAALV